MEYTVKEIIDSLYLCGTDNCEVCSFSGKGDCFNELMENAAKLLEDAYKPCEMGSVVPNPDSNSVNIMLDEGAIMPTRAHETDAGLDLYAPYDFEVPASRGFFSKHDTPVEVGSATVDTGFHIELPPNTVGVLKSKSGLNVKHGLTTDGTIDVGFCGSIVVKIYNHTGHTYYFKKGEKIAQLVILPILTPKLKVVEKFAETERGNNGFGSSGR